MYLIRQEDHRNLNRLMDTFSAGKRAPEQVATVSEVTDRDFDEVSEVNTTYEMGMETNDALDVLKSIGMAGTISMDDLE